MGRKKKRESNIGKHNGSWALERVKLLAQEETDGEHGTEKGSHLAKREDKRRTSGHLRNTGQQERELA
jgi:hypothetical protein